MTTHLLPGIGGTADMYSDYSFPLPVRRLDYLRPPSLRTSFADYAKLFASHYQIQPGDCVVGMSMGGMLACEISKSIPLRKLVLISSGTHPYHVHPLLRQLAPLAPLVPFGWIQRLTYPTHLFGTVRHRALRMFKASDPLFLRWSCYHATRWDGLASHSDLTRIHGSWDPVFPLAKQQPEHILPHGGHIVLLRRPDLIQPLLIQLLAPLQA